MAGGWRRKMVESEAGSAAGLELCFGDRPRDDACQRPVADPLDIHADSASAREYGDSY